MHIPYLVQKPGRNGPRYYWQPSRALARQGWRPFRLADDFDQAVAQARARNAELAAAHLAAAGRTAADRRTVRAMVAAYQQSRWWRTLAPKTQRDYHHHITAILAWAGDDPVQSVTPQRIQGWYEHLFAHAPHAANARVRVLRLVCSAGRRLGYLTVNPAEKPGLTTPPRCAPVRIWTPQQVQAAVAAADAAGWHSIGTAVALNEWLGQRRGDLLRLPRTMVRDGVVRIRQSKTGAPVELSVGTVPHLVARIAAELASQRDHQGPAHAATTLLVCETTGRPWSTDHFSRAFRSIADAAGGDLANMRFAWLRHTAVTRLAEAGCEIPQIAAVTGHRLATCSQIIDRYLVRTGAMAREAFERRLNYMERTTGAIATVRNE